MARLNWDRVRVDARKRSHADRLASGAIQEERVGSERSTRIPTRRGSKPSDASAESWKRCASRAAPDRRGSPASWPPKFAKKMAVLGRNFRAWRARRRLSQSQMWPQAYTAPLKKSARGRAVRSTPKMRRSSGQLSSWVSRRQRQRSSGLRGEQVADRAPTQPVLLGTLRAFRPAMRHRRT